MIAGPIEGFAIAICVESRNATACLECGQRSAVFLFDAAVDPAGRADRFRCCGCGAIVDLPIAKIDIDFAISRLASSGVRSIMGRGRDRVCGICNRDTRRGAPRAPCMVCVDCQGQWRRALRKGKGSE